VKPGPKVDPPFEETWAALEKCVEEGLIRSIGVSNFSPEKIESSILPMAKIRPAVNQACPHPNTHLLCLLQCSAALLQPCSCILYPVQPASCFQCIHETMRLLGLCHMQCSSCMDCCMRAVPVTMTTDWCVSRHSCCFAVTWYTPISRHYDRHSHDYLLICKTSIEDFW